MLKGFTVSLILGDFTCVRLVCYGQTYGSYLFWRPGFTNATSMIRRYECVQDNKTAYFTIAHTLGSEWHRNRKSS
jgi:hypothetical protein